jgi:ATP-dependent DNA helicase DinG
MKPELLINAMDRAVQLITGDPDSHARPAQLELAQEVARALNHPGGQAIGQAGTGTGKALAVTTPIPVPISAKHPTGWALMGELKRGDEVFDEFGSVVTVSVAHRIVRDRECFRLTFSDGSWIIASGEHLWPTIPDAADTRSRVEICREVRDAYAADAERTKVNVLDLYEDCRGALPMAVLAEAAGVTIARLLPVKVIENAAGSTLREAGSLERLTRLAGSTVAEATSILGIARLAGADESELSGNASPEDVERLIGGRLPNPIMVAPADVLDEAIRLLGQEDLAEVNRVITRTQDLGRRTNVSLLVPTLPMVLPDARLPLDPYRLGQRLAAQPDSLEIPHSYLRASTVQRLALLQGIMDVAGAVDQVEATGETCLFAHPSRAFTESVLQLLATFGIHVSRSRWGRNARLAFNHGGIRVFRCPDKAAELNRAANTGAQGLHIIRVEKVEPVPVRCITVKSPTHLFLAGTSCVPTHNSLAYLVPAALAAAVDGKRTVVSTESLSLQSQLVDKDAPVVTRAVSQVVPGTAPKVAVLKGWSNHACLVAARETAHKILRIKEGKEEPDEKMAGRLRERGGQQEMLVAWALDQYSDPALKGDRHSYTGVSNGADWASVSVTPAECIGVKKCPFADRCKAARAKVAAAEADVVVTNHTLLAVEAANGVPAVTGSKTLGHFDAIVMDEAHGMPSQVRNQGAGEVTGRRIRSLARSLTHTVELGKNHKIADAGDMIAQMVDKALNAKVRNGDIHKVGEDEDPAADFGSAMEAWLTQARALIVQATKAHSNDMSVKRVLTRFDNALSDLNQVRTHTPGVARWVEAGRGNDHEAALRYSTVNVSAALKRNLWIAPEVEDDLKDRDRAQAEDDISCDVGPEGDKVYYPMSVVAVSATIPQGFAREMGLDASVICFPSPFDVARKRSAVYVPRAIDPADIAALSATQARSGKPKLDTSRHAAWVIPKIAALVEANGGRALVLAAKSSDGKAYAEYLRTRTGGMFTVLDQWDGLPLRELVERWRSDETAVLVGTRSLMTGVDAPGTTCSLVIIDRIPRSPSNPVDDARLESLMSAQKIDRWRADRQVYVADAALLVEQAAGRLIRSGNDKGMVALLDPRLLKKPASVFSYPEQTRKLYMRALGEDWGRRISKLDTAVDFLKGLHE